VNNASRRNFINLPARLLVLGPAAIIRIFLSLLTLLGILLALIWLTGTFAPKDSGTNGAQQSQMRQ